jgi:hypothetical protein
MMNVTNNGTTKRYPIPSFGVMYVEGHVTIYGTLKGKLTLYASGGVTIGGNNPAQNDLVYNDQTDTTSDLLGILSGGDIVLHCVQSGSGPCASKTVDGLLWADNVSRDANNNVVSGTTIYNDRWSNSTVSGTAPTLTIKGAMITAYRGTFGTIESDGGGKITSGWAKNFVWDARLESQQPPYMLRDALATFVRSTTKDIPCDNACN